MLWTDSDFITSDDLLALDSEVQEVATAESVPLDVTIHRGLGEAANKLMMFQQTFGGYLSNQAISGNHYNAVMNVGLPAINRQRVLINQVVVSAPVDTWTPIKTWAGYYVLVFFYRIVASRAERDRYQRKRDDFNKSTNGIYFEAVRSQGLPIIRQPLPCPGALFEPAVAGVFGASNVSTAAGSGTDLSMYDFAVTWVDQSTYQSPANKNNAESGPSVRVSMNMPAINNVFVVNINGLTAPNGTQHPSTLPLSVIPYGNATGWNVYAGLSGGTLFLQNSQPIPIATKSFTFPANPLATGYVADTGQFADLYYTFQRVLQRA